MSPQSREPRGRGRRGASDETLCLPCISPKTPSQPPVTTSTRAASRKSRVYVLRRFLLDKYPDLVTPGSTVMDVAGGKGDLSWILTNADGVDSVVVDPRRTHHTHLVKSVRYLLDHPEEAELRAIPERNTHQPLAALLPQLMTHTGDNTGRFRSARHLRLHLDDRLVHAVARVLSDCSNFEFDASANCAPTSWVSYWAEASERAESSEPLGYQEQGHDTDGRIVDATEALRTILRVKLVVGFHPDQATDACIDLARMLRVPFAVVPCCVFPSEFPERKLDGEKVKSYDQLLTYLRRKVPSIRLETLDFYDTKTAKNVVLYTLQEDF